MAPFADFLTALLTHGSARFQQPPLFDQEEREAVLSLLEREFRGHLLDIAGPPLPFAPEPALQAALFTYRACWFLVHRGIPAEVLQAELVLPTAPRTASDHASADVVFRLLPAVHRRARAADPADLLTARLEELLRAWPLSGALADIAAPPTRPVDLGGHPGLLLLYAERLSRHPRPAWVVPGASGEYVELLYARHGLALPEEAA